MKTRTLTSWDSVYRIATNKSRQRMNQYTFFIVEPPEYLNQENAVQ